jgi:hypothetical protein
MSCTDTEQRIAPVSTDAVSCGESCSGENRQTYLVQGLEGGEDFTERTDIIYSIGTKTVDNFLLFTWTALKDKAHTK